MSRQVLKLSVSSRRTGQAIAVACLLLGLLACRQDMHNQPKYIPLRSSEFFPDGLSARLPVPGTVAQGELREDSYFYTGKVGIKEGDRFPFPITEAVMERGRERFNIYCTPCHSRVGDGNGMIVQRGYRRAASFHEQRVLNYPVGHFYDVITHGWGAMPDYAAQLKPADRWAVAAYIRALQYSQNATVADVPPDQRNQIKDISEMRIQGISLAQAEMSGGAGGNEGASAAGSNPIPAMNKQIEGRARPQAPNPQPAKPGGQK